MTATITRPLSGWGAVDTTRMLTLPPVGQRDQWHRLLDRALAEDIYAIVDHQAERGFGTAYLLHSTSGDGINRYTIVVHAIPGEPVRVGCTCHAAMMATPCKHAAAAIEELNLWRFDGESQAVVRDDLHDVVLTRNQRGLATVNLPCAGDIEWGYLGAGPSHLAHVVLSWAVGPDFAAEHAYDFKCEVIALVPRTDGGVIAADQLAAWCVERGAVAA